MKLSSEPKPVKVRITSGGKEHSTLASLLKCFKWEDLEKNEEQVRIWLRRQGKAGINIASQWKEGQKANDAAELFNIYDIFFLKQNGINSIDDMFDLWSKDQEGKTDNLTFLLQSLLSLNYHKAIKYIIESPDEVANSILGKNNVINGIPSKDDLDFMTQVTNKLHYEKLECNTSNLIRCFYDLWRLYNLYNPELFKIPPLKVILSVMRSKGYETTNLDMELLIVYATAYRFIARPVDEARIVENAMKAFGLSDLNGLKSRKDKIAAFFIALLRQRLYYHKMNKSSLGGIAQCYNYNYMAKLLYDGAKVFEDDSSHNTKKQKPKISLELFQLELFQEVRQFFMRGPDIINMYVRMNTESLAYLWNLFCVNINILEIK